MSPASSYNPFYVCDNLDFYIILLMATTSCLQLQHRTSVYYVYSILSIAPTSSVYVLTLLSTSW